MSKKKTFSVTAKLKLFNAPAAWVYISIPLDKVPKVEPRGWGSIPVMVTIGKTTWRTSLFPLKKDDYFIPIKKEVRKKEGIDAGDTVTIEYSVA